MRYAMAEGVSAILMSKVVRSLPQQVLQSIGLRFSIVCTGLP